jgi:hypothetical protein
MALAAMEARWVTMHYYLKDCFEDLVEMIEMQQENQVKDNRHKLSRGMQSEVLLPSQERSAGCQ